ncbi:PrgI family protein [Butyricicoccus sp. 1XD8-22]|nr:PrgI family protein [Butyricicoccus sp. 1XD8-22]
MRVVELQVDMVSEQKNLLGFMSTRQAIYLGIGLACIYAIVPPIFNLINGLAGMIPAIIVGVILSAPFVGIALYLSFAKNQKTDMFRDKELFIKFRSASQLGYWRSGYDYDN